MQYIDLFQDNGNNNGVIINVISNTKSKSVPWKRIKFYSKQFFSINTCCFYCKSFYFYLGFYHLVPGPKATV